MPKQILKDNLNSGNSTIDKKKQPAVVIKTIENTPVTCKICLSLVVKGICRCSSEK